MTVKIADDYEADVYETDDNEFKEIEEDFFKQYAIINNINFTPIADTTSKMPAGYYKIVDIQDTLYFAKQKYDISELIRFSDTTVDMVIKEFKKFWNLKKQYEDRGEPHRRGFMLHGPPGGGKTSTISIIADVFIKEGNLVIDFNQHLSTMLPSFRQIEPERKILILIEDIDTLIDDRYMEKELLHLLDGDIHLVNTAIIATTNFPENLPDRIINRPSRFDRIESIGMPGDKERRIYLEKKSRKLNEKDISLWVKKTDGYSFAHLKELLLAVEVFELSFKQTLDRLDKMRAKKDSSKDYENDLRGKEGIGF